MLLSLLQDFGKKIDVSCLGTRIYLKRQALNPVNQGESDVCPQHGNVVEGGDEEWDPMGILQE